MTSAPRRPEPAWTPRPGPEITLLPAGPGAVRTARNGVQWHLDPVRGWQPVVHKPEPEREAGA
jgi:hypothetical protein